MKFIYKKTYYPFPVHEFNLPAGHTCPFANECKVKVDRATGKFTTKKGEYRCYAAMAERFPAVRNHRWGNFEYIVACNPIILPQDMKYCRIHGSGDFFAQWYFDEWVEICNENSHIMFWAFPKSVRYWVNRLDKIPKNLCLQASYGGLDDHLIAKHKLKFAKVFPSAVEARKAGLAIDTDDRLAMSGTKSFALIDNFSKKGGK